MAPRSKSRTDAPEEAGDDASMQDAPPSHQPDAATDEGAEDEEMDQDENYDEEEEEEEAQRVRLVRGCGCRPV